MPTVGLMSRARTACGHVTLATSASSSKVQDLQNATILCPMEHDLVEKLVLCVRTKLIEDRIGGYLCRNRFFFVMLSAT